MDDTEAKQLLGAERARVEEALAALQPPDATTRDDQREPGVDLFEAGRDDSRREQLETELRAVERAEQRLADGTYGLSVESGDPIADDRLRAQPTAERTVEEQQIYSA